MNYKIMRWGNPSNALLTEVVDALPKICDRADREAEFATEPQIFFIDFISNQIQKIAAQYRKCLPPYLKRWEDRWGRQFLSFYKSQKDYAEGNSPLFTVFY